MIQIMRRDGKFIIKVIFYPPIVVGLSQKVHGWFILECPFMITAYRFKKYSGS